MTYKEARKYYAYNKVTGKLFSRQTGKPIGTVKDTGYLVVNKQDKQYYAHRIAFLLMEGYTPENVIDHIDGNRTNNKWENLRHVTQACNAQNKIICKSNKSGYTGVCQTKKITATLPFRATASLLGKQIHIGYFSTALKAAKARIDWEDNTPEWHCDKRNINRTKVLNDLNQLKQREDNGKKSLRNEVAKVQYKTSKFQLDPTTNREVEVQIIRNRAHYSRDDPFSY